jgi:hypothetical protein
LESIIFINSNSYVMKHVNKSFILSILFFVHAPSSSSAMDKLRTVVKGGVSGGKKVANAYKNLRDKKEDENSHVGLTGTLIFSRLNKATDQEHKEDILAQIKEMHRGTIVILEKQSVDEIGIKEHKKENAIQDAKSDLSKTKIFVARIISEEQHKNKPKKEKSKELKPKL